jgi:hypothetical protein
MQMDYKSYVSEEWLRTYVHERGKDGEAQSPFGSPRRLRLAEARATLHSGRRHQWRPDLSDTEEEPP